MELMVPTVSDVIFKYIWPIANYKKTISKKHGLDSPTFDINVNGIRSSWNMSIRFWKGPEGKRITNPVVLCLNILNSNVDEAEQAKIRFQFAVFNADVNYWEFSSLDRTVLELRSISEIVSIGHRDLCIVDRHYKKTGEINLLVKIQIIHSESEKHNLSQDMEKILKHQQAVDTVLLCSGEEGQVSEIPVHSCIVAGRSEILESMIVLNDNQTTESSTSTSSELKYKLELLDLSKEVATELLRYIYTDHINNLDNFSSQLLSLSTKFKLQGLKELCERSLIETITPENVATRLLLADEFGSDNLKRASLTYCEENAMNISKNLAWKVMEQVNPELFQEVCDGIGSSRSSIDDSELSN